jgi:enoyl-CoA hydratase/carnithine racemase|tara:strand:- start:248 stop:1069 length:822 start_codon:yes stop_codon:yes gene_type:complete
MTEVATESVARPRIAEPILLREEREGIVTLTLNRPKQYNALSEEMLAALQAAFDDLTHDESARVVVIAANGKAFSAGHDLREMRSKTDERYFRELFAQCGRMMLSVNRLPQPVIARVQGIATAAGCQLVAACDLAVAAEEARFATSGINLGLFCSTPAVPVSRNLARKNAFEMLFTGDFINAPTALDWGLVNRVVSPDQLDAVILEIAEKIAAKPPEAVRLGKAVFYQQLEMPLSEAYNFAGDRMACNLMYAAALEGVDAFLEKRRPSWSPHT